MMMEGTPQAASAILSAERVSKSFGEVPVLFSIDFDIKPGEVHAVVGENGAGKSTLMKILSGLEAPTSGTIRFEGNPAILPPDGQAEALGIVVIHQELNLAEHLTVTESIFLGREMTRNGFLRRTDMQREAARILDLLHMHIDVTARIKDLPIADRQMVEIARAISRDARVLIMDEPTAVLSVTESEALFEQIERLRQSGVAIVFISHKLDEVKRLADRVTVLRDGQLIATVDATNLSADAIAQMMVGRELSNLYPPKKEPDADASVVFEVENLSAPGVDNVSFTLRQGEILGFSGLIGSGRTAALEATVGLTPPSAGTVTLRGEKVDFRHVGEALAKGLVYMTKDRKGKGLLLNMGLRPNLTLFTLARHVKNLFLNDRSETDALDRAMRRFDIRARDNSVNVGQLSGGNQQKLLLGKTMEADPDIIIIDEPTRGIDVGTKQQLYHIIAALAAEGKSIIVISSEMQEIIGLCHRVVVMREGHVAGTLEGAEISEHNIVRHAAGLGPRGTGNNERLSA